jgi:hypothetical protein
VYRIEYSASADPDFSWHADLEAWQGDEDARQIKDRPLGTAFIDFSGEPSGGTWFDTRNTDGLHQLHPDVMQQLFDFDDAIREALR